MPSLLENLIGVGGIPTLDTLYLRNGMGQTWVVKTHGSTTLNLPPPGWASQGFAESVISGHIANWNYGASGYIVSHVVGGKGSQQASLPLDPSGDFYLQDQSLVGTWIIAVYGAPQEVTFLSPGQAPPVHEILRITISP